MHRPPLRDVPIPALAETLGVADEVARRIALAVHKRGALDWDGLDRGLRLRERARFGPLLETVAVRRAEDGTRKLLFRTAPGEIVETVLIRNARAVTLCLSSQAGCAFGCAFALHPQRDPLQRHGQRLPAPVVGRGEAVHHTAARVALPRQDPLQRRQAGGYGLRPVAVVATGASGGHLDAPPGIFTA